THVEHNESALPPGADVERTSRDVRVVPIAALTAYFVSSKADTGERAALAFAFVISRSWMTDPINMNRRNWDERAAIHARDTTGFYSMERFRAGESALHGIEAAELGDVHGKRVLHLQCHIGLDTLRLARLGAVATGLDFSSAAVEVARGLAEE